MNYIKETKLKNTENSYNMIVEILKGSKSKTELVDKTFEELEEVRVIKHRYPFYYGCFPQTHAGDSDPLDCILVTKKEYNLLDIAEVQVIGAIKTIDEGEVDDKIITIPSDVELNNKELKALQKILFAFLAKYKGKNSNTVIDHQFYDVDEALKLIEEANAAYIQKAPKSTIKIKI